MSRELRPRRSGPNYAAMLGLEQGEDGAGPSNPVPFQYEPESDSEFDATAQGPYEPRYPVDDDDAEPNQFAAQSIGERPIRPIPTKAKGKAKAKQLEPPPDTQRTTQVLGPSLPRGYTTNKMYTLPIPSVHHRHRAVPLFFRSGPVERLDSRPKLFKTPGIVSTNNCTFTPLVQDRVNKAWGYNIGSGPLWELMEDRGWYKEAIEVGVEVEKEANRRPRVHVDVKTKGGWEVLLIETASAYLPSDNVIADDGGLKPPPPLRCYVGPFGNQTRIELNMFETLKMSDFIPESKSHIFNAGAPVWGLDWCPIHADDRSQRLHKQYLAIAPFPSHSHSPEIGVKAHRSTKSCVQIWTLEPARGADAMDEDQDDRGQMKCNMVLCLEGGPAHSLKWCPLPSHDFGSDAGDGPWPRKLGLLAGTFEDGSLSIYAVPEPADVTPQDHNPARPVFIKLFEPLLRIELEETSCWSLDWANSELIAVGCANGNIAIYDVGKALKAGHGPNILPTHYLTIHQSAIRALTWIRAPPSSGSGASMSNENPTVIASGGYDGLECLTDIRDPHGNVMNRTRDVINSATFSPYGGGPVTIDHENTVKAYSVSPSMLGRGHTLLEPSGPVWSVHASDYHPQLAVGSADGSCVTTNALRSTRRGGSVPFFVHKIYQLDYNRTSGELRMLERFFPQETPEKPTSAKSRAKLQAKPSMPATPTGVWPPVIGIHLVAWNCGNGLANASLLGSATASGMCRVDWLEGRWMKGKIPYHGVENIRREGIDANAEGPDDDGEEDELEDED